MARTRNYQHFCPVARSLEVIGEKWSLLIVRDLLRGPQRFSDLLRYLGGITPKWLTLRLRDLEAAGIVARDSKPGRREVWYRLTPKGRDLAPVVNGLMVWGIQHAMRPPLPGEHVFPEQTIAAVTTNLNHRDVRPRRPTTWLLRFDGDRAHTIRFDGERWSTTPGDAEADVLIETTADNWIAFLTAREAQRPRGARRLRIEGARARVREFLETFSAAPARAG
jgi:DNA-binding HxlR family transcriptional regulator